MAGIEIFPHFNDHCLVQEFVEQETRPKTSRPLTKNEPHPARG
jgi:hypothetical protein